ncbi:MAG: DUF4184 family protein [Fibrobacterota bacterium]|nr:DUF4184 family protein [Fibrobacterota bacterium]QQS07567.1 MAG: DUF4184 family protein [Fibrobacterota bacterium]
MPFTTSHIIAAIGIHKVAPRLSLSALAIGTMSPDFEYLLRLKPMSSVSHTAAGSFLFCVPAGLVVWALHGAILQPALSGRVLGEHPHAAKLDCGLRNVLLVAVAVWIGALTHIVWDGFTHAGGFALDWFPVLRSPVWTDPDIPLFKILQHGSSLAGAVGIGVWVWRRHRSLLLEWITSPKALRAIVRMLFVGGLVAMVGGLLNGFLSLRGEASFQPGRFVVGCMDAVFLLALLDGILFRWRRLRRRP